MGFFDFIFSKKKKERQAKEEAERQEQLQQARMQQEKQRSEEEHRKRMADAEERKKRMEQQYSIKPFVFKSTQHHRYQDGAPVGDLQQCVRTLTVEKNVNGCKGYKITPGVGYIVKLFNDDLGRPQMSDKPMKVVSKTAPKVELRGYPLEAMGPFGWMDVDYSDYGLTVYYKNDEVDKCVFHMFDRNVDLEYVRNTKQNNNNPEQESTLNNNHPSVTKEELQNAMKDLETLIKYMINSQTWQTFTLMVDKPNIIKMWKAGCVLASYYEDVFHYGRVKDVDLDFDPSKYADDAQRSNILTELSSSWLSVHAMLVNFRITGYLQDKKFVSPYIDSIGKLNYTLFPKLSSLK